MRKPELSNLMQVTEKGVLECRFGEHFFIVEGLRLDPLGKIRFSSLPGWDRRYYD
jgi:hypothetical protein